MNKSSYHPYEDENLHQTVNIPETNSLDERAPFNDAIKHSDMVQGIPSPKRIEQLPKWYQNPRRMFAAVSALIIISLLIYQVIQFVIAIRSGQ
ncbi:hypothetical protein [Neobacillus muris]|uniref:hypothetical protein n=1 Tax=Neobacillus muris TaxID=2941334 RepID=UPI00203C1047|nr:hypothetical protein [Neobacillus muris]